MKVQNLIGSTLLSSISYHSERRLAICGQCKIAVLFLDLLSLGGYYGSACNHSWSTIELPATWMVV